MNGGRGLFEPLMWQPSQYLVYAARALQLLLEPLCHPRSNVLAVTQAVLLEGNALMVRQEIQVTWAVVRNPLNVRAWPLQIPLVPNCGGEHVRIANQDRAADPGFCLLHPALSLGDVHKFGRMPLQLLEGRRRLIPQLGFGKSLGELLDAVLAPVFGDPACKPMGATDFAQVLCKGERDCGRTGRLGPDNHDLQCQGRSHRSRQKMPVLGDGGPDQCPRNGCQHPPDIQGYGRRVKATRELDSVLLRGEYSGDGRRLYR